MFEKVNLEVALKKELNKSVNKESEKVLSNFKSLFEADWEREKRHLETLSRGAVSSELPDAGSLEEHRIYDLRSIQNLCVKYRLRFLSTRYFKGEIPRHAMIRIKETENKIGRNLDSFMIMAPSAMFKLENANKDPLLFAPLEDGRFYLIDKWGNDLAWYRKLVSWPLKTPAHLLATVLVISAILASILPTGWLTSETENYFNFFRIVAFGWNAVFILGMLSFLWFSTNCKFSVHAWNSKYFN